MMCIEVISPWSLILIISCFVQELKILRHHQFSISKPTVKGTEIKTQNHT
jgi:hypothetical protein